MRYRAAALIASRVLAAYVAFHAVIYGGEVLGDLIRSLPAAEVAESALPMVVFSVTAWFLWFRAPRIAGAMLAGTGEEPGDPPPTARDIAIVAFAVTGLYVAGQALPLVVYVLTRVAAETWTLDRVADLIAALARAAFGIVLVVKSRAFAAGLFPRRARAESDTPAE